MAAIKIERSATPRPHHLRRRPGWPDNAKWC
jgi:hypothetical protein